jgi:hypothetical protein
MKVIARPIGTGKTKELMEMALEADGIILTTNKRALQVKAEAYGFDSLYIIDLNDLLYGEFDDTKPLFVHKLDDVMQEYFKQDFNLDLQGFSVRMEE